MNLISEDYLMHHGVKGMKWGVRHDPERVGRVRSAKGNVHRGLSYVYSLNEKTYRKLGNNTLASMNAAAKNQQLKKAKNADKESQQKRLAKVGTKSVVENARSSFAKGVGKTYKVNEYVENKKGQALGKVSDKPIIGKVAKKKQITAQENAKYYKKTGDDLVSGKVAPPKTKYQKFIRAAFKNPAGKAIMVSSIKTSPYLKTGQQKATAMAEIAILDNYYAEQKKRKKAGLSYNKL